MLSLQNCQSKLCNFLSSLQNKDLLFRSRFLCFYVNIKLSIAILHFEEPQLLSTCFSFKQNCFLEQLVSDSFIKSLCLEMSDLRKCPTDILFNEDNSEIGEFGISAES